MKKMVLPALLCVAYTVTMAGFFSTDISREHSFFSNTAPVLEIKTLEPSPMAKDILHSKVYESRCKAACKIPLGKGASPESASK